MVVSVADIRPSVLSPLVSYADATIGQLSIEWGDAAYFEKIGNSSSDVLEDRENRISSLTNVSETYCSWSARLWPVHPLVASTI